MGQPLVDTSLAAFDAAGRQIVFPISPFGASETREERLARWQALGFYDPECAMCRAVEEHPTLDPFQPRHDPNPRCRSGKRAHCTCDACF